MRRAIYEDDVIKLLDKGWKIGVYPVASNIHALPPAQSELKRGEWITNLYAFGEDRYECDQCHNTALHCYDFCPNCGADMRGEQDE